MRTHVGSLTRHVVPPAPLDDPFMVKIASGIEELLRGRLKTLKSYKDKGKTPESRLNKAVRPVGRHRLPRFVTSEKISHFLSLPLELMVEIARYTHPTDLLSLSRTCAQLHSTLASKSARFLWKSLLNSVQLAHNSWKSYRPPIPSHMNELQYTDLVWGTRCMACHSPRSCETIWSLFVRLCRRCQPLNLVGTVELLEHANKNTKASKSVLVRMVYTSPTDDDYFRSPAYLCNNMASDKDLFFREEAMFILDSLIEAKKCCKQHVKFESYISAIALNAYSRVEAGQRIALAFSPHSVKFPRGRGWTDIRRTPLKFEST